MMFRVALWPHDRFAVESRLTPPALAARLASTVHAGPTNAPPPSGALFRGVVSAESFDVVPILRGRVNSWRPRVRGTFSAGPEGITHVVVTMRLDLPVTIFMIAWLGFAALTIVLVATVALAGGRQPQFLVVAAWPLLLGVLGYATMMRAFSSESRRVRAELESLLGVAASGAYR
jgi:hypothetical protein